VTKRGINIPISSGAICRAIFPAFGEDPDTTTSSFRHINMKLEIFSVILFLHCHSSISSHLYTMFDTPSSHLEYHWLDKLMSYSRETQGDARLLDILPESLARQGVGNDTICEQVFRVKK
jgi:hypothetical protein